MIHFDATDVFLVTGGSAGIGMSTALRLNELGATVIAVGRNAERLGRAKAAASAPERFHVERRDLSDDFDGLAEWVRSLVPVYGPLRGLIHSAGVYAVVPLKVFSLDAARRMFDLNYFAGIAMAKGFARKGVFAGEGSSLVFLSSISSIRGFSGVSTYSATKGAINASVRSLAFELARQGIRVNAVMPGFTQTDMSSVTPEDQAQLLIGRQPLGLGRPQDVADLCAFLVSNSARFITGQCIAVDGGGSL
jgi:NAD(P)-dependent dehydrogenase (short-subunit alcohol dehydrogenase family)